MVLLRAASLLVLAACMFGSAAWAEDEAGVIEYVRGSAFIERGAQTFGAKEGQPVHVGDVVRTGAHSRARIRFVDGSRVQLGSNAAARIERYRTRSDGSILDALIDLIQGRGRFVVEKLKSADARYRVRTRAVLIGVRGTDILAQSEADAAHVALIEGRVELTREGGRAASLAAGEYVRAAGAWPVRPEPIPAAWLDAFIRDVGSMREGARRKKDEEAPAPPLDAIQRRSLDRLGSPTVVPR